MSELDSTMVAPAAPTGEIPAAPERTPRDSWGVAAWYWDRYSC